VLGELDVEGIVADVRELSGIRTPEVVALLGVTKRQLNEWRSKGWIEGLPSAAGSGTILRWRPEHIDQARRLAAAARLRGRSLPSMAAEIESLFGEAALVQALDAKGGRP
jgi:hypothetical protein